MIPTKELQSKSPDFAASRSESKLAIVLNSKKILFASSRKSLACVSVIVAVLCASQPPLAQNARKSTPRAGNVHSPGAPPISPRKTPITANGIVDSGPVVFEDITKAAGLSGWKHTMGAADKGLICDVNGSGVGLIDYDNDGWLDIYLVNGSNFNALDGKAGAAARRSVSQQPRRHIYRCCRQGRRDQRSLGLRRGHRRL